MKYKLTEEKILYCFRTLYRIQATEDYPCGVKCGELGGFVESEKNLHDNAWVSGNAEVYGNADYIVFKNWWSSGRYFTWTRSNNMWKVGCFFGTGKELVAKAHKDSLKSGREYERIVNYVESIIINNQYKKWKTINF